METKKRPTSTAEAANKDNNNLISDYFKQARSGWPKKRKNMINGKITVEKTKGQVAMSKIARSAKSQYKQVKHKSTGSAPSIFQDQSKLLQLFCSREQDWTGDRSEWVDQE